MGNKSTKVDNRLAELRKSKGMTQAQLAASINICRQSISDWERGITRPTHDNLLQLSELYGVSVDYLLGRDVEYTIPSLDEVGKNIENNPAYECKSDEKRKLPLPYYRCIILVLVALLIAVTLMFIQTRKIGYHDGKVVPIGELSQDIIVPSGEEFD